MTNIIDITPTLVESSPIVESPLPQYEVKLLNGVTHTVEGEFRLGQGSVAFADREGMLTLFVPMSNLDSVTKVA